MDILGNIDPDVFDNPINILLIEIKFAAVMPCESV